MNNKNNNVGAYNKSVLIIIVESFYDNCFHNSFVSVSVSTLKDKRISKLCFKIVFEVFKLLVCIVKWLGVSWTAALLTEW